MDQPQKGEKMEAVKLVAIIAIIAIVNISAHFFRDKKNCGDDFEKYFDDGGNKNETDN